MARNSKYLENVQFKKKKWRIAIKCFNLNVNSLTDKWHS